MGSIQTLSFQEGVERAGQRGTRGLLLILTFLVTVGATAVDLNEAGKAAYTRGDFAAAERLFNQAIAEAPNEPLLHYHRAVVLSRLRRWREASEAYQAVLRLDPPPALAAAAREGLRTLEPVTHPPSRYVHDRGGATIPLRQANGGWFTEVVINTSHTAQFLVDTGASLCVISPGLAGLLGIKPGRSARSVELRSLAGPTMGPLVTIRSVQVGGAMAKDVHAVVHGIGPGIDGILGNSFLSRYTVTLDPDRGVLRLQPRRER